MDQKKSTYIGLTFAAIGLLIVALAYMGHRSSTVPGRSASQDQTASGADGQDTTTDSSASQSKQATSATTSKGNTASNPSSKGQAETAARNGQIGETKRPGATAKEDEPTDPKNDPFYAGRIQPVKGTASPQAASVLEALKTGEHSERISALLPPKDASKEQEAFKADPTKYCNEIVPGRVFCTAQPAPDVPVLKAVGERMIRVGQNEPAKLTVKGAPLSAITFTSMDAGAFLESKLNSATVRADKEGNATATYVAGPGVTEDVNILSGSCFSSGQVSYKIVVESAGGAVRADPTRKE